MAVVPPPEALGDLAAAVAPGRPGRRDLRWTGPEDWHVTLAFLGEVPGPAAGRLAPRLERAAARHRPFPLTFAGAGAFPAAGRARVFWCGLTGDHQALAALAASVAAAARRAGAPPPDGDRPFRPHLTLARGRPQADVRALVTALKPYQGPPWRADHLHLIESHLGGRPRYTTIGRWPLGGATGGDTLGL